MSNEGNISQRIKNWSVLLCNYRTDGKINRVKLAMKIEVLWKI